MGVTGNVNRTAFGHLYNWNMGTGLPFAVEIAFLILALPLAIAWLLSVAGLAMIPLRAAARKFPPHPDPASPHPRAAEPQIGNFSRTLSGTESAFAIRAGKSAR